MTALLLQSLGKVNALSESAGMRCSSAEVVLDNYRLGIQVFYELCTQSLALPCNLFARAEQRP
jgi:hypothetical protein